METSSPSTPMGRRAAMACWVAWKRQVWAVQSAKVPILGEGPEARRVPMETSSPSTPMGRTAAMACWVAHEEAKYGRFSRRRYQYWC